MIALVLRTIAYYHRLLLPVAAGVAVSSAVIVGALIVGDSMRGSLRFIALDRIGSIERIVIAPRWFRESSLDTAPELNGLLMIDSVVAEFQTRDGEQLRSQRATEMSLFGVDANFWSMGDVVPDVLPDGQQLVLNRALADKLGVQVGDAVTLKVSRQAVVPADSALGKRDNDTTALSRWEVVAIVPDASLGRFSLRSDQRPVLNAFASKSSLQKALEIEGLINAVAQTNQSHSTDQTVLPKLALELQDIGLTWQHVRRVFPDTEIGESQGAGEPAVIYDYDQLMSDQMLLNDALTKAFSDTLADQQPKRILTYLANNTEVIESTDLDSTDTVARPESGRPVPYSTISGLPWELAQSMLKVSGVSVESPPADMRWVILNRWIADEMKARVGDRLRIDYYLPETVDGTEVEKHFEVQVVAIAPLTPPSSPYRRTAPAKFTEAPTPFNDTEWTPEVPGITDQESISSWETPFPLERKIESADDEYWTDYRLTPKLFIDDALARELFGSRFGDQTSLRFDGLTDAERAELAPKILTQSRAHLDAMGWREIAIREQQLRAASGTTPFDALFLSLSFFVIAASLLLVALLFRLTIERRADHWGLLMASGWTRAKVRRLLLCEASLVALLGATLGVGLGVGYAYAMLAGLRSWWVGAISVSFLNFYVRPESLWIGWLAGFLVSLLTTWLVTRQLRTASVARLLKGRMENDASSAGSGRWILWLSILTAVLGVIIMFSGVFAQGQAQAGAFVGSGMLWMVSGVLWMYWGLRSHARTGSLQTGSQASGQPDSRTSGQTRYRTLGILGLSRSNAQRSPVRSILTVSLMAIASFLILSMSLFQAQPDRRGTGGIAFVAKSAQGIAINIGEAKQQRLALASQAEVLTQAEIVSVRMRGGDDASCNNLFQAHEPQVLGISADIARVDRDAQGNSEFAWFATDAAASNAVAPDQPGRAPSPWRALETSGDGTESSPIPVILDQNTALWALHLGGYTGETFAYTFADRKVHFRTVAVSQNTVLQGSLWIGESNFQRIFPEISGYRLFLVKPKEPKVPSATLTEIRTALETGWSNEGLSCASASDILARLLAVQNTYLSAFQVLGGLGLLLGTLGLGVTQLRSALERSSELAAMRAMGFSKNRLIWTLSLENGWQLIRGIGIGLTAALLASAPVLLQGQGMAAVASPLLMLLWVVLLGLVFCVGAAVLAMRQPLLASLRADR